MLLAEPDNWCTASSAETPTVTGKQLMKEPVNHNPKFSKARDPTVYSKVSLVRLC